VRLREWKSRMKISASGTGSKASMRPSSMKRWRNAARYRVVERGRAALLHLDPLADAVHTEMIDLHELKWWREPIS